ncbi:MAG: murein biosynthesis integral membrane protein MurJ [Tissierellia bacterium]|nr:murein biosynthesis integral membrane protein MurJ [Tissierellia bacterium]
MKTTNIAKASIMISALAILSKAMGALRVMVIGWKFGQGVETDAYNAAVKVTALSMSIIASAIFTSLVPVLAQINERHGVRGKFKFFNNISNIVMLLAVGLSALVYIFAPVIIKIMFTSFSQEKFELAVHLTRLGVPIILSLAMMNLVTGYLHSFNIYGPYAVMGIPYNVCFFLYLFFLPLSIEGLIYATVIATFSQFLVQAPAMFKTGYRWKPLIQVQDPYVTRTIDLVIPVALGQAVQQINVIVDGNLASGLADGVITAMDNATKVNDAIIAIFIAGFTTVIFPMLATAFERNERSRIVQLVDDGFGAVLLITIPATVGIMTLSTDLIKLMFERNMFTAEDTIVTAGAFFYYSLGLTGSGLRMLFTKVYYSFQDTKTPMINGMFAVIMNVILNLILVRFMEHRGLALATSISITVTTFVLIIKLKKKLPEMYFMGYFREFIKIGISAAAMGAVVLFSNRALKTMLDSEGLRLLIVIGLAVIVYAVMVLLTRVNAVNVYLTAFLKKRKARNQTGA